MFSANQFEFTRKHRRNGLPGVPPPAILSTPMGKTAALWFVAAALLSCATAFAGTDCLPIQQAGQHVGETKCVTGTVHRVAIGNKGVHFLDFCEDQAACPFTVVVFPSALRDVGDVRRLTGRNVEIHGAVKLYDGKPEIILNRVSQITNGAAMIPSLPKNYDVEKQGHYSAGRMHPPKRLKAPKPKADAAAAFGDVEGTEPP